MSDIIDKILLSPSAMKRWTKTAMQEAGKGGYKPEQVPDEQVQVKEDGSLLLFVDFPDQRRVSMRIEPSEWSWMPEN